MTLYEKILVLYPELISKDFENGNIRLRNDGDERGDYIEVWNHPTFIKPTQEQLDTIE
jgi:uncharacterized protein YydD (DUF2326 family)